MQRRFSTRVVASQDSGMRVFGLYRNFGALRAGASSLRRLGFGDHDVSVLFPEGALATRISYDHVQPPLFGTGNKLTGPLIGGTLARLTYIRPEGAGAVSGALISMGIPVDEAEQYELGICDGRMLVCARSFSGASASRAMEALLHTGAENIVAAPTGTANPEGCLREGFNFVPLEPLFESRFIC